MEKNNNVSSREAEQELEETKLISEESTETVRTSDSTDDPEDILVDAEDTESLSERKNEESVVLIEDLNETEPTAVKNKKGFLRNGGKTNKKKKTKIRESVRRSDVLKEELSGTRSDEEQISEQEQKFIEEQKRQLHMEKRQQELALEEYKYRRKAIRKGMTAREMKRQEKSRFQDSVLVLRRILILALLLGCVCVMGLITYNKVIRQTLLPLSMPFHKENTFFGFSDNEMKGKYADSWGNKLVVCNTDVGTDEKSLTCGAALLFDIDHQEVLYAKNVHQQRSPASITKIMTALVALKYGDLNDQVKVTNAAYNVESGSSVCDIKPGDVLTLKQLVYGLMVASGNDAAMMIAEHIAGSTSAFVDLMNEEALRIGATETHFMNPHGLTQEGHYTTAYDIYLIMQEALKSEVFQDIISRKNFYAEYTRADGSPVAVTWDSTNHYFTGEASAPEGVTIYGGKTGTTEDAGACLALRVKDAYGQSYISIILHGETKEELYTEMSDLLTLIPEHNAK